MFKPMAIALVHYPVLDRRGDVVTSAVTNLDVHDLARLATTYGLCRYYIVTPATEQQLLTARIVRHDTVTPCGFPGTSPAIRALRDGPVLFIAACAAGLRYRARFGCRAVQS